MLLLIVMLGDALMEEHQRNSMAELPLAASLGSDHGALEDAAAPFVWDTAGTYSLKCQG